MFGNGVKIVEIKPPEVYKEGTVEESITSRILHILGIYPKISPSMMQIGIGSSLSPPIWKPILRKLIEQKVIQEDVIVSITPSGRHQTYTILSLVKDTQA